MRSDFIQRVQQEALKKGMKLKSQEARNWMMGKYYNVMQHRHVARTRNTIMNSLSTQPRLTSTPTIGKMFFYWYDPKHKDTLPFYDQFPLVIPIEIYDDGFLGLNMHYLDLNNRAGLLDNLMRLSNNRNLDESTKLNISYKIVSQAKYYPMAAVCLKRYLTSHQRSFMVEVLPSEFEIAIFLPVEKFTKSPMSNVHENSRSKIYG